MIIAALFFILAQLMTATVPMLISTATGLIWCIRSVVDAWNDK